MFKKKILVTFRIYDNGYKTLKIGYLVKDKDYKSGYKIIDCDGKSGYDISILDEITRI